MIDSASIIRKRFEESIEVKNKVLNDSKTIRIIEDLSDAITKAVSSGHKLVLCGNGGSASDALHFAGEIVGRFQMERPAWPAVVLNADVATLTAIANDYGYDSVFARQAQGLVNEGDVFIGITTSGNSKSILRATEVARQKNAITAAFTGKGGGIIKGEVDFPVVIESDVTARIQESHICVIHILCELIELKLTKNSSK